MGVFSGVCYTAKTALFRRLLHHLVASCRAADTVTHHDGGAQRRTFSNPQPSNESLRISRLKRLAGAIMCFVHVVAPG